VILLRKCQLWPFCVCYDHRDNVLCVDLLLILRRGSPQVGRARNIAALMLVFVFVCSLAILSAVFFKWSI